MLKKLGVGLDRRNIIPVTATARHGTAMGGKVSPSKNVHGVLFMKSAMSLCVVLVLCHKSSCPMRKE